MNDYYRVLQVDPEADPEIITAAFRVLARRLHPDRDITGVQEYRMAELNRAYSVLRDPAQRRQYDAERKLMQPMGPGSEADGPPRRGGLAARWNAGTDAETSVQAGIDATETRLNFGRYAGMTLREIAGQDTDYLRWLSRHSSGLRYRAEIEGILGPDPEASYSPRASR
jgi:curved DNA-binding protein CbpA